MAKTLEQQMAETEARLARLREKARRKDTRQKIIVGAIAISEAMNDPKAAGLLIRLIDAKVKKDVDKADIAPLVDDLRKVAEATP